MDTQTTINNCTVENNIIKLPGVQLERDIYLEVSNKLKKIGGKWKGGKVQGFVFDYNPSDLLADLQNGKNRNIKKEFQLFESPQIIAKRVVGLAEIEAHHKVCEPEAGRGAIIREIPRQNCVDYYEINELLHAELARFENATLKGRDFLYADESIKYDRIVANPPFSNNQDIDHIQKMYSALAPDGILVSVASTHWRHSYGVKEMLFRAWLHTEVNAEIFEVEAGAFKESGTNIETVIIRIRK